MVVGDVIKNFDFKDEGDYDMFNIEGIDGNIIADIRKKLPELFYKSGIEISGEVVNSIFDILLNVLAIKQDGSLAKLPKDMDFGKDTYGNPLFNLIPSNKYGSKTDTLVVCCAEGDSLNNRLDEMLSNVAKWNDDYRIIIFITTKWDSAAVTGKKFHVLHKMHELKNKGVTLVFILVSTAGISDIPVI